MRLSTAAALGRTLVKFDPMSFLDEKKDGQCVGCVIGMGLAAVGFRQLNSIKQLWEVWPWLKEPCQQTPSWFSPSEVLGTDIYEHAISRGAHAVAMGRITLDTVIDYIRSVEPPESDKQSATETPVEMGVEVSAT